MQRSIGSGMAVLAGRYAGHAYVIHTFGWRHWGCDGLVDQLGQG